MSELDDATHEYILDGGNDTRAVAASTSFLREAGFSEREINALFGDTKDHLPGQHNQLSHGNAHAHGKYGHIESGSAYVAQGAGATKFESSKTYEQHVKRVQKTIDDPPAKYGVQYRDKVKHLMLEAEHLGMTDHIVPLKKKIGESFYKDSTEAVAQGKMKTANKLAAKALEMGYEPGKQVEAPSPSMPPTPPPTATAKASSAVLGEPSVSTKIPGWENMTYAQKQAALSAEWQKKQAAAQPTNPTPEQWQTMTVAQKQAYTKAQNEALTSKGTPIDQTKLTQTEKNAMQTKPLNTTYLAGTPSPSPAQAAILTEFNNKYVGKEITTQEQLKQKMAEYAEVKQKLSAIKIAEQQQLQIQQKETQAKLQQMAKEQAAKKAAEFAAKYGNYPNLETAYEGLKKVYGGDPASQISQAESKIKNYPDLAKLHPIEAASIAQYTGSAYREINSSLRVGAIKPEHHAITKAIDSGLDKLPPFVGNVIRRKNNLPADVVKNYQPGMVVTERAFTSTSTKDIWNGKWLFNIVSKTGRNVRTLSKHEHEHEVLFKRNTDFLVKKVEGNTIWMEEM